MYRSCRSYSGIRNLDSRTALSTTPRSPSSGCGTTTEVRRDSPVTVWVACIAATSSRFLKPIRARTISRHPVTLNLNVPAQPPAPTSK
jgi:hypothetical protein